MADDREGSAPSNAPHLAFPQIKPAELAPSQRRDELRIAVAAPGQSPEEAQVERVHTVGVQLTHGGRPLAGGLEGRSLASAVSENYGRAGTLAQNLLTRCATCKHFDPNAAVPYIEAAITKMKQGVGWDQFGRPRNALEQRTAWEVVFNRESTIKASGVCHALTEALKGHPLEMPLPVLVHPDGGCPQPAQLRGPRGEDLSGLYVEREVKRHARGPGVTAYDTVLNAAAGKK